MMLWFCLRGLIFIRNTNIILKGTELTPQWNYYNKVFPNVQIRVQMLEEGGVREENPNPAEALQGQRHRCHQQQRRSVGCISVQPETSIAL